jgi:hypothetical protein
MVTIATTRTLDEAFVMKSALEGSGIPSFIPDEMTAQTQWGVIAASGGIRLQVAPENADAARRILSG